VVKSFGSRETETIYNRRVARSLPPDIQARARRKLVQLDEAQELNQLRIPPSNRLEALKGDLAGFHSIRVNQQWRIIFKWNEGDAFDVEIVDYH
jgi:proteic killer suppression protein